MKYNIVRRNPAPYPPYHYDLVCIPLEAIPYVAGALRLKEVKYWWASADDTKRGNDLLVRFTNGLLMPCGTEIINRQDALYNLLDAALNGRSRSVTGEGTIDAPYEYTPEIPQTVDAGSYLPGGLRATGDNIQALTHNLVDGSATTLTSETRNFRAQLADIKAAIEAGEVDTEDMENLLNLILLALA